MVGITGIGTVVVVMLYGRSFQMLFLEAGGLHFVVVISGTHCDASSNSSATTLTLNDLLTGGPLFISRYKLNFSRLDIIVERMTFPVQVCQ